MNCDMVLLWYGITVISYWSHWWWQHVILPWPKKSLQPRYSWDWSAVRSCDISRHRLRSAMRARDAQLPRVASLSNRSSISHDITWSDRRSTSCLGCNDFFGQGSSFIALHYTVSVHCTTQAHLLRCHDNTHFISFIYPGLRKTVPKKHIKLLSCEQNTRLEQQAQQQQKKKLTACTSSISTERS